MGEPGAGRARRTSYRDPTVTGVIQTASTALWGAGMAGERSDLHKVLFLSSGGSLEQWEQAPGDRAVDSRIRGTAVQADAVLEWLAGRDRLRM